MKQYVSISEYIQWRDKTKGGLVAKRVEYNVIDARTSTCVAHGTAPVTDAVLALVTAGLYSSTVLAALDVAKVDKLFQVAQDSETSVCGDVVKYQAKIPVFHVVAIDEDTPGGCAVYVEGVV